MQAPQLCLPALSHKLQHCKTTEHTGAPGQCYVRRSFVTTLLAPLIACIPVALLIEAVVLA